MDADFRERWGTEEVRIDRIELLNEVGEKIDRIETNGAMSITTQLTAQTSVRSPVIKVSISKLDGDIVWSSTSRRSEIGLGNLNSPVLATIAIPKLPLLEGTYYISVACTDATGTTDYDHCQNWVRFDVHQNDLFEEGLVAVPSNWTIHHLMQ